MGLPASFLQHGPPVLWALPLGGFNRRLCVSGVIRPGEVGEQRPNEPDADGHHDHPFHRDEAVRIGRSVHVSYDANCYAAVISGHPSGRPDEDAGRVYLAVLYPPYSMQFTVPSFLMWRPQSPGERPPTDTWHWARACPYDR